MQRLTIKKTDLNVSSMCMGGCPLGGYGWGDTKREELIGAVRAAVENGINFFDTADTYGLGESERTLAEALGKSLNDVIITTKFGVRVENGKTTYDNSREYIFKAVEGSLKRLNRDYIDLYQVHYRDGVTPLAEVAETLELLRQQGKIRYFGLSNIHEQDIDELKTFGNSNPFVSFQNEYSLACRKNENDMFRFRDIHLFDERITSDYLTTPGTSNKCTFMTMPLVDGFLWSTHQQWAGLRVVELLEDGSSREIALGEPTIEERGKELIIRCHPEQGEFTIRLSEQRIDIEFETATTWAMELSVANGKQLPFKSISPKSIAAEFNKHPYSLHLKQGEFREVAHESIKMRILPAKRNIILDCNLLK